MDEMMKRKAIEEFIAEMEGMEAEENEGLMSGMRKVTVAAPDDEGLEMGLSKAEQILQKSKEMSDIGEDEMEDVIDEEMPDKGMSALMEEEEEEEDFAAMMKKKLLGM